MKLYKILATAYEDYYGTIDNPIDRLYTTTIAQKPDCSAFLFLCKDTQDALTGLSLLDTVPDGFDFTYCQEWGMGINDAIVAEVILDLRRKAYGKIGDQLDLLYKDMLADKGDKSGEWFKHIKAVKDANPKE